MASLTKKLIHLENTACQTETYCILEYLSPVAHQHESDGGGQHDDQEWPVELPIQSPSNGEESKHDQDDNIGD